MSQLGVSLGPELSEHDPSRLGSEARWGQLGANLGHPEATFSIFTNFPFIAVRIPLSISSEKTGVDLISLLVGIKCYE